MKSHNQFVSVVSLIIAVVLVSCNDELSIQNPYFDATISGELDRVVQGQAANFGHYSDSESGKDLILLQFESGVPQQGRGIIFQGEFDDIPDPGTYPISAAEVDEDGQLDYEELQAGKFVAFFITGIEDSEQNEYSELFLSTQGEFIIDEVNGDAMIGEFQFDADGYLEEAPDSTLVIEADGHFEAIYGDVEVD